MTSKQQIQKKQTLLEGMTSGQISFGLFGIFCLLLILRNATVAIDYMTQGLNLCAKTVIPSLFPFMVISELIIGGGIVEKLPRAMMMPLCRLFRLPAEGCCAAVLGMLCGFPIGARCAIRAYEQGQLTRNEAERVLCFSCNPSSAFLITAVGTSLWGNRSFGVGLYVTVLIAATLTGIIIARIKAPHSAFDEPIHSATKQPRLTGARLFTESIRSSVSSILLVCAYVVFFSALVGTFRFMPGVARLPDAAKAFLFCLFELSSGVSQATGLTATIPSALLCAFAAGWSGISVHCQLLAVCDGTGLSLRPYLFAKLLQALLCPLLFFALLSFFPALLIPSVGI